MKIITVLQAGLECVHSLNPMKMVRSYLAKKLPSQGGDRTVFKPALSVVFAPSLTAVGQNLLEPAVTQPESAFLAISPDWDAKTGSGISTPRVLGTPGRAHSLMG